ncbi:hypothetical protein [Candidatus Solirubrobacter pratensis]|uniref:hypothetical protein n=1 Tax=Candidatus Solirubrobacter pratensis TaxID=1298857 RepID=UPI00048131E9|nr:hypothetical protein [Candidatus Solirubrobacter pratensis]
MASLLANMGLVAWPSPTDQFSSAQLALNMQRIDNHDHSPGKGKPLGADSFADGSVSSFKLATDAVTTTKLLNGAVTVPKLDSAFATYLGITQGTTVRRGKSMISAEESVTTGGIGFQLMPTPDRVTSVSLPTDGLISVAFQAMWKAVTPANAMAALFLNSTQVQVVLDTATNPASAAANMPTGANLYRALATSGFGLHSSANSSGAYTGDATTGQIIGVSPANGTLAGSGVCHIFAAAGTYDVSVRYATGPDPVTAKNRKLWVWTTGF